MEETPVVSDENDPNLQNFYGELSLWDELSEKPEYMACLLESEKSLQQRIDSSLVVASDAPVEFDGPPPVAPAAIPEDGNLTHTNCESFAKREHQRQLLRIRSTLQRKWDRVIAVIVSNLDVFRDDSAPRQENFYYTKVLPGYELGVFVNLSKNPRFKAIEFEKKIITATLPKSLALQSIAICALHAYGNTASAEFDLQAKNQISFNTVGGVLFLDLFELPEPPIKVGGWTMRVLSGSEAQLQRLAYPFKRFGQPIPEPIVAATPSPVAAPEDLQQTLAGNLNGSIDSPGRQLVTASKGSVNKAADHPLAQQCSLHVTYKINISPFLNASKLQVMWWDSHICEWSSAGISDQEIDLESGLVQFKTLKFSPHAVVAYKYQEIPYRGWQIVAEEPDRIVVTVYGAVNRLEVAISPKGCTLLEPLASPAIIQPLPPDVFLSLLSKRGLNFVAPPTASGLQDSGLILKHPNVESSLIKTLSTTCAGFAFRSTTSNARLGTFAGAVSFQRVPKGTLQLSSNGHQESALDSVELPKPAHLVSPDVGAVEESVDGQTTAVGVSKTSEIVEAVSGEESIVAPSTGAEKVANDSEIPASQSTMGAEAHQLSTPEEKLAALHASSRFVFPETWKTLVFDSSYTSNAGVKSQIAFVAPNSKFAIEPSKFPLVPTQLHATPYQALISEAPEHDSLAVKQALDSTSALLEHYVCDFLQLTGLFKFS